MKSQFKHVTGAWSDYFPVKEGDFDVMSKEHIDALREGLQFWLEIKLPEQYNSGDACIIFITKYQNPCVFENLT